MTAIVRKAKYQRQGDVVVVNNGSVKLTKTDSNDPNTVLPGAVFDLYRGTNKIGIYTTDTNDEINVGNLSSGTYCFVETRSPAGYVLDDTRRTFTVTANQTVQVTVTNTKSAVPGVFSDDHYAYIIGYSDGTVRPGANITCAEVATIFFRLLDDPVRDRYMTTENNYSDVEEGMWFNTAVSTMSAMGILSGYPDGSFHPNSNITRAEFAVIAARFDEVGNTAQSSLSDIYGHWAYKEINTAAGNGWVLGYENGTFMP